MLSTNRQRRCGETHYDGNAEHRDLKAPARDHVQAKPLIPLRRQRDDSAGNQEPGNRVDQRLRQDDDEDIAIGCTHGLESPEFT